MYKTKPRFPSHMPSDAPLNVLALNASLKHEPAISNTGELASLVIEEIRALTAANVDVVRLSDATLPAPQAAAPSTAKWPALSLRAARMAR